MEVGPKAATGEVDMDVQCDAVLMGPEAARAFAAEVDAEVVAAVGAL